jgi:D-amino-acid oxidase
MRVIVVGAGVIGLSCALRLAEHGHDVAVLARDLPPETTSSVAAALWYPYHAFPREAVVTWSAAAYSELSRLAAARAGDRPLVARRRTPPRLADDSAGRL